MKLKKIYIQNFRCIEDISISLSDNINVFIGRNGDGKSTILDAISISLSLLIDSIMNKTLSNNKIPYLSIRNDSPYSSIEATCLENGKEFKWKILRNAHGKKVLETSNLSDISNLSDSIKEKLKNEYSLPVIVYYPVKRIVHKVNNKMNNKYDISIFDTYENSLRGKQNFKSFFEWIRLLDDICNERIALRSKWINKNYDIIENKINKIIKLIKNSSKLVDNDKKLISFKSYLHFILTSPDPQSYLFYNFDEIINNKKIFSYLESYKDIRDKDNLHKILNSLKSMAGKKEEIIEALWELFISFNIVNSWWFSTSSKQNLEECLENYFQKINNPDNSNNLDIIYNNLEKQLTEIIDNEIHRNKNIDKYLSNINQAIEQFSGSYKSLAISRFPRQKILIYKDGIEFDLNQLSDGEKNVISLIGDIARRLIIANPNSNEPLKSNGIILIDEIDLHLHPEWQMRIIPKLLEIFPNCQFIVTTHSPTVISNVKSNNIFLLKNENNKLSYSPASESYGKNSDRILEDLFKVDSRPKHIKKELEEIFTLIDNNNIIDAKKQIKELNQKIGNDPELIRANTWIKRKEIIGK